MAQVNSEGPFFNLKAVVRQTGLSPDTLRAWERRYGLPAPKRSSGGHRLYSRRDIETIQWLIGRQREGLSIKRAVELWFQLEAEAASLAQPAAIVRPAPPVETGETIARLREEWIAACLAYDEQTAEQVLTQAFALYPPEVVATELLEKAVAWIGEGWYRAEVTVHHEHFASALAVRRLESWIQSAPPPSRSGRILAACPAGELHVIGLLLLTLFLRRRGWGVIYLGADVPTEQLETAVQSVQPRLVILAAQQLATAATLWEAVQRLQSERVPLAYGGLVFNRIPRLRGRIAGHFLGETLDAALTTIESFMAVARPTPRAEPIPARYLEAREHYQERQSLLEADLIQTLYAGGMALSDLQRANRELSLRIGAALTLGGMDLLDAEIAWLEGMLSHHRRSPGSLDTYLEAYGRAVQKHLDARGEPIKAWFRRFVETAV